jgi:outer membrane biosynthesis protein TonB
LASAAPTSTSSGAKTGADASSQGGRSEASIRQTLEANKSSLYTLYNRALRANPLLKGKVVFELVIQPDGSVAQVNVIESELNDERLERQLQLRLQAVNFGAAEVAPTRSQWTIAFLPG